jgi:hypothetical protein
MTESRIQQEIVMWYWNTYPERRGTLFEVYNNPASAKHGAFRKAMGMVAGVSDLCLVWPGGVVVFVEIKGPTGAQSATQKAWQKLVEAYGCRYHIVRSLEEFKAMLDQLP